ncbi:MAG: tryptophan synthase subunit alpha [Lachnospiraceae bacterium]|nr:tryptophan synthase subunit alpha [Lachnospiraceae bacterium]
MSKTSKAFADGKAFIPFITAGDPDADSSVNYILAAAEAGADLIEIGIPFSDPTAEGPVIQEADAVALENGMTVNGAFEIVERVRAVKPDLPLAFMTYINPVFKYRWDAPKGVETEPYVPFFKRCKAVGIDALILADLPYEEQQEVRAVADAFDVDLISMVSPTSEDRIRSIAKDARGFVYIVSSMGVTGVRSEFQYDHIGRMAQMIRETNPDVKCAVGFGISKPEQAKEMAALSDGAIVGSAILRMIHADPAAAEQNIYDYVKEMKEAVTSAGQ